MNRQGIVSNPLQLGQVRFNFTELLEVASLDTCSFYMLKDSRWRFTLGVEIRCSARRVLNGACFVKQYAS